MKGGLDGGSAISCQLLKCRLFVSKLSVKSQAFYQFSVKFEGICL